MSPSELQHLNFNTWTSTPTPSLHTCRTARGRNAPIVT